MVVVGHSYGGMLITGVSSRLPGRIRSLVYLDARLPTTVNQHEVRTARRFISLNRQRACITG